LSICQVNATFKGMTLDHYPDRLNRAVEFLRTLDIPAVKWCVVLGSGLGNLSHKLDEPGITLTYQTIPGFPKTTVKGHGGNLVFGKMGGIGLAIMEGRFHLYEGHNARVAVLPHRVLMALGVTHFIITNAAGGIHPAFSAGDLLIINDHINLSGTNPLTGPNLDDIGPRFPAISNAYDPTLRAICRESAELMGLPFREGVYAALPGPCYETQAEIHMLRCLGADAVGMSTVPEVIAIKHAGCTVAGLSLITNVAHSDTPPSHQEVVDMALQRKQKMHHLIIDVITRYNSDMEVSEQ
jgi:purine-nucleoside phosphorylase